MGRRKKKPTVAGKAHLVPTMVDNPDWRPDREGEKAFPRQVPAVLNVRESAVETLRSRGFLAASQKAAADRFRELWEAAGGKTISIDYTLDRVDGGKGDPITGRLRAAQELQRCRLLVGQRGYDTLQAVCGEGKALAEISPHKRDRLTMADNLRADLDDLASMWGMQTRRRTNA